MNRELVCKALDVLETTECKQGRSQLSTYGSDGWEYCALGILALNLGINLHRTDREIYPALYEMLGSKAIVDRIWHWNDTLRWNFKYIAQQIKKELRLEC